MNALTTTYLLFCGGGQLLLLGLKLARVAPVATWSWWAVTAPLWGPWLAVALGALALQVLLVSMQGLGPG